MRFKNKLLFIFKIYFTIKIFFLLVPQTRDLVIQNLELVYTNSLFGITIFILSIPSLYFVVQNYFKFKTRNQFLVIGLSMISLFGYFYKLSQMISTDNNIFVITDGVILFISVFTILYFMLISRVGHMFPYIGLRNKKILIADDDPDVINVLEKKFKACGSIVYTALNGEDAALLAEQVMPHAIVMDIDMPKVDGFRSSDFLHSSSRTRDIPIICFSANVSDGANIKNFERVLNKKQGFNSVVMSIAIFFSLRDIK